jgi:hypothetical protein
VRRDRDPAGRPRNARARDELGRPLARDAGEAGQAGEPRIPDDLALAPADTVRLADELLRAGRPFHAHEVLEAAWKTGPATERDLWQGLAQIAVGLTHALRGNARGAVTLLRRGAQRVRTYQARGDVHDNLRIGGFLSSAERLADDIDRRGLDSVPPEALRPGLTAKR